MSTKAKLDQAIADQDRVTNEMAAEVERLKAKLAEEQKPKLRHGDYGIDYGKEEKSVPFPMLAFNPHRGVTPVRIAHKDGSGGFEHDKDSTAITWLGNIFDDLKALQKDVTEGSYFYECEHGSKDKIEVYLSDAVWLSTKNTTERFRLSMQDLSLFILKLRQMEATLKRKTTR